MKPILKITRQLNQLKKGRSFLCLFILFLFLNGHLFAQDIDDSEGFPKRSTFRHAINTCVLGPFSGVFGVSYEYLISPHNGILGRVEYETVPKTYTDANIDSWGIAYSLNYREHFSHDLNTFFVGAFAWYRTYYGEGQLENIAFDVNLSSFTVGMNVGKRFVWNNGFNAAFSIGYGLKKVNRKATPSNAAIETVLDELEDSYDFSTPIYPEVSVGYAF